MKQNFYPKPAKGPSLAQFIKAISLVFILSFFALLPKAKAQGLVFRNSYLQSGAAGQVNAVYRFPSVTSNIDALVKISGRSSSLVRLESIDLSNTGFDKAFQPQVSYNNGTTPNGISDWWMEFTISFVNSTSNAGVTPSKMTVTGLDIDGNGDRINEWVGFYNHKTYTLENNSLLLSSSIWELINSLSTVVGTKFNGPVTNFLNIDTAATRVMSSANYENVNSVRIRTGGHSTGQNSASERMYSFWFKSFNYTAPIEARLPVTLKSFLVTLENKKPSIGWVSSVESNLSHYVIERSMDGNEYKEIALVFAAGNSTTELKYSYIDKSVPATNGIIYYRLRMVDMDTKFKLSETRLVRMNEAAKSITVQAYPNPAINELRITIPAIWQSKKIQYEVFAISGQSVKRIIRTNASQTEVMDISQLMSGSYIIKVTAEKETATQQFVKSK